MTTLMQEMERVATVFDVLESMEQSRHSATLRALLEQLQTIESEIILNRQKRAKSQAEAQENVMQMCVSFGQELSELQTLAFLYLGQAAALIETEYGGGTVKALADSVGFRPATLYSYIAVVRKFGLRRCMVYALQGVYYSHFRTAMYAHTDVAECVKLLQRVVEEQLTVAQLEVLVHGGEIANPDENADDGNDPKTKKVKLLSIPHVRLLNVDTDEGELTLKLHPDDLDEIRGYVGRNVTVKITYDPQDQSEAAEPELDPNIF